MSIAIQPSLTSRVKAYAEAHPGASPKEIAAALGLMTSEVTAALARSPVVKAKSKVAVTFPTGQTGQIEPKAGEAGYVSVEQSALKTLKREAGWRKEKGLAPTKLDLELEAGKTKLWSE